MAKLKEREKITIQKLTRWRFSNEFRFKTEKISENKFFTDLAQKIYIFLWMKEMPKNLWIERKFFPFSQNLAKQNLQ